MAEDPSRPPAGSAGGSALRSVSSGLSWNTIALGVSTVTTLALTPVLIHHLGSDRYGIVALVITLALTLSNFDAGIGAATTRFVAVHLGADEHDRVTRLVVSVTLALLGLGLVIAVALFAAAHALAGAFDIPHGLRDDAATVIRVVAPLTTAGLLRGAFGAVLAAESRWRALAQVTIVSQAVYVGLVLFAVHTGGGVLFVVLALLGQQVTAAVLLLALSLRTVRRGRAGLLTPPQGREFLRYAGAAQLINITTLVNTEFDAVVIAAILPVRYVGFYSVGAGLAGVIRVIPINAAGPLQTVLARAFGGGGVAAAHAELGRLQRFWVRAVLPLMLIAAPTALYGIPVWVGHSFREAGVVAAVLLVGYGINLLGTPTAVYAASVGRPGLESRYGVVTVVLNVVLTVPLGVAFGLIGVVVATSASQIIGVFYLRVITARALVPRPTSFLDDVPVVPTLVAAGAAAGLTYLLSRVLPVGVGGFLVCGLVAGLLLLATTAVTLPEARRSALGRLRRPA